MDERLDQARSGADGIGRGPVVALVALSVVLVAAGSWNVGPDHAAAAFRAVVALGSVAVAWWLAGSLPTSGDPRPTTRLGVLAWPLAAVGAVAMVQARTAVRLTTVEGVAIRPSGVDVITFVMTDQGLPNLLHRWLNGLATVVGGEGLVLVVHAALYGVMVALLADLAERLAGRPAGAALTVAYATSPTVIEMFAGLRGYPSYVLLVLLAERAMVAEPGRTPSDRWVVRTLGLAAVEIPTALSTLAAYALGRVGAAGVPRRLWALAALVGIGIAPVALRARVVHARMGRPPPDLEGPILWGLIPALLILVLLADAWRARWQRPAVAAAGGALALVVGLVLTGGLDVEPRYGYQSGLLGAVLATAWTSRRLGPARGSALSAVGVVIVAVALLRLSPGRPMEAATWLWGVCGLAVLAVAATPRLGRVVVPVICVALVGVHLQVLRSDLAQGHASRAAARVSLAHAVASDTPLCLRRGIPLAMVEVAWLSSQTRGWWHPLVAEPALPVTVRQDNDPHCADPPVLRLASDQPLSGCLRVAAVSAEDVLWRCDVP